MAITFPLAMPNAGVGRQKFEIQRNDFVSPESSGRIGGVTAGSPLWTATWTLGTVSEGRSDEWRAFVSLLRGSQRQFFGRDFARPRPRAYGPLVGMTRATGGAFDGSVAIWAIEGTGTALTLTGLPAGFLLSWGDYVSFRWTTGGLQRRALVRAMENRQADAYGSVSVTVEPSVPNVVPSTAVAWLDQPDCLMRLITGQTDLGEIDRRRIAPAKISAIQDLLP